MWKEKKRNNLKKMTIVFPRSKAEDTQLNFIPKYYFGNNFRL